MFKRKRSYDVTSDSTASVFDEVRTKRLFRSRFRNRNISLPMRPASEGAMTQLFDFIIQHEEAFKNPYRLASLYTDFRGQLELNPEGYHANIAAWTNALTNAARAGVVPTQGTAHDLLGIRVSDELAQALQHPQHGKPTCLPAIFHEGVKSKEMLPLKDFMGAKESIYKTSWIPSPWAVLCWGARQVLGPQKVPEKLQPGDFVILKNVEVAADQIMKKMKDHTSTADRVLSRKDFLKRFSTILNSGASLTTNDLNIILTYLARDKQAISFNAQTIKFKSDHEAVPLPITEEDTAIANLRDTLAKINMQLLSLTEKVEAANAAAREAVAEKQMVRAKAALRSKKMTESVLAQRMEVALQLENVYTDLQQAADQVEIVEAMRAGAAALKGLNEKVGGAEGVQGVVDAVNEQMATTEEIANIINENSQPLDEAEIDDEFEALEKAEREKRELKESENTAARLAELEETEKQRKDKEAEKGRSDMNLVTEEGVNEASQGLAKLSFVQPDDEELDAHEEKRIAVPA